MDEDFVLEAPPDVPLSEHIRKQAVLFARVRLFGRIYYLPISRGMKKAFGITIKKGKISVSYGSYHAILGGLQDIVSALYIQVRDTVGAEVSDSLSRDIQDGLKNMFEKNLNQKVEGMLSDRMGIEYRRDT